MSTGQSAPPRAMQAACPEASIREHPPPIGKDMEAREKKKKKRPSGDSAAYIGPYYHAICNSMEQDKSKLQG
jgi:hypothetical protein